jgi:Ca-activated chloride channel family protein
MSFAAPLVLLALLAIPLVLRLYLGQQRRRARAATAFVSRPLIASVAPRSPGWRRHAPILLFTLALAALIVAAARPQRSVAVPLTDGAVMLVDDVSSSMASTDVAPSRLGAAERAAGQFIASVPAAIRIGLIEFNQKPVLLQSPTTDHSLARSALGQLHASGHTAIGDAINRALGVLTTLRTPAGKRPPGAIVLLSDGTSTTGADPLVAARQAAGQHIPIYTVALGTQHGTITNWQGKKKVSTPVPLNPVELQQIARLSGGREFTAANAGNLKTVYDHLAAQLGRKHVNREVSASFAGGGLVLLLMGSGLSLAWFGRLV